MPDLSQHPLRVSIIQADISWHDPAANRARYDTYLVPSLKTDLVVLPEMFSTGFSMQPAEAFETMDGLTVEWMRHKAQELNAVITGSLIIKQDQHYVNRMLWVQPDGHLEYYDKRHLFRYAKEHLHYQAGNKRLIVTYKGWRIALFICYDLRFPVWCRNQDDYDLALYVANWPDARQFAWDSLLVARAIENLSYVAANNRIGADPHGNHFSGGSVLLDFKGEKLAELGDQACIQTQALSLVSLREFRTHFPTHKDADAFTLSASS